MFNLLPRWTPFLEPDPVPEARSITIGEELPVAGGLVPVDDDPAGRLRQLLVDLG